MDSCSLVIAYSASTLIASTAQIDVPAFGHLLATGVEGPGVYLSA